MRGLRVILGSMKHIAMFQVPTLSSGQHEEACGGSGHDDGQPSLHQDQPQPGEPG